MIFSSPCCDDLRASLAAGEDAALRLLHGEGSPLVTADISVLLREGSPTADIAAEQSRISRADALVLVYPVYWWGMPGLLKGWIDRVFTNGWAYDDGPNIKLVKRLRHLDVHLIALGGADMRTYARHGYFGAMKTQIDHGIFDYCGAHVVTSELLLQSDARFPDSHFDTAYGIGQKIFAVSNVSN